MCSKKLIIFPKDVSFNRADGADICWNTVNWLDNTCLIMTADRRLSSLNFNKIIM